MNSTSNQWRHCEALLRPATTETACLFVCLLISLFLCRFGCRFSFNLGWASIWRLRLGGRFHGNHESKEIIVRLSLFLATSSRGTLHVRPALSVNSVELNNKKLANGSRQNALHHQIESSAIWNLRVDPLSTLGLERRIEQVDQLSCQV